MHWSRVKKYGNPNIRNQPGPKSSGIKKIATCIIDGCSKKVFNVNRMLCHAHYNRWYRHGDPLGGKIKGKPYSDKNGYMWLYKPDHPNAKTNGLVAVHQMVMADILGRSLLPGENVHHKNGIRSDNRPENLELWISSQPPGQRVADLVSWAKGIIDIYGGYANDHKL